MALWKRRKRLKKHAQRKNHHQPKHIALLLITLVLTGCSSFKPQALDYAQLELQNSSHKSKLDYAVYTPPGWQAEESLPLVVFLHGGADSHETFEQYGGHLALDKEIKSGRMPRAIVVFPNGDNGFWENWVDGTFSYRDWVLDELIPKIQNNYQTLACPEHCHIAGISMGGFGALRMAVFADQQFSGVAAISAPIFYLDGQAEVQKPSLLWRLLIPYKRIFGKDYAREANPTNPYNAFIDKPTLGDMRIMLIRGTKESEHIVKFNEAFHNRLNEAGIEHKYVVYQGGHKWRYWIPQLGGVMRYLLGPNSKEETKAQSNSD